MPIFFTSIFRFIVDSIGIQQHITVLCRRQVWPIYIWELSVCEIIQQIKRHKMRFCYTQTPNTFINETTHMNNISWNIDCILQFGCCLPDCLLACFWNGENLVVVGKSLQSVGIYFVASLFVVVLFATANISWILNWSILYGRMRKDVEMNSLQKINSLRRTWEIKKCVSFLRRPVTISTPTLTPTPMPPSSPGTLRIPSLSRERAVE